MPKITSYPDGGAKQDADQFVIVRGGVNRSILGSAIGSVDTSIALTAIRVYTADDTWAKPADLHHIIVELVAGGGGGGGVASASAQAACAMAGGGGEYAMKRIAEAALGATEAVTVGAGGAGGAAGQNAGADGNASSFGAHVSVNPGGGGDGSNSTATVPVIGFSGGGEGGTGGAGGDIHIDGSPGLNGIRWSTTLVQSSVGGGTQLGAFARPSTDSLSDEEGVPGKAYGGGGSGARSSNTTTNYKGGDGADGVVIVYEYTYTT